jgi:hypothetical protein
VLWLDTGATAVSPLTGSASGNIDMNGFALQLDRYSERVFDLGNVSGAIGPSLLNGTVQTATLTGAITMNGLGNVTPGSSMTLIFTQDATGGRLLSSTMQAPGGVSGKTLSTAPGATDILNVFYDGTVYYLSLTKGFLA